LKLELSLPERPALLHALPLCDLLLMLWILFVLSTALLRQSGVAVELPVSSFQLERYQESHVITLAPGAEGPRLYLGRDRVRLDELQQRLTGLRDEGAAARSLILLQADASIPVGMTRQVEEMALALGFHVALLGGDADPPSQPQPSGE